jgi:transposase
LGALRYREGINDDDFSRVPPAAQTCIRKQETCSRQLCERITQREEQFCLAQRRCFPPSRDKFKDRVLVEAEHITRTERDDVDAGACNKACVLPLMRGCQ